MKKDIFFWVVIIAVILLIYVNLIREAYNSTPRTLECENDTNLEVKEAYENVVDSVDENVDEKIEPYEMTPEDIAEEEFWDSLETLAICVEAEAGTEDLMGKRLVVDVILNRVDSDKFPNDINSVIADKNQFSSYTNGAMERIVEPSEETFEAVRLELEQRTDSGILYFTANGYNPSCNPAYKYGDHYFGY